MAWWDALLSGAGNYASNNPLEALALGAGAAGTGMGIYDLYRQRQAQADRQKQIDALYRQGPEAFMPRQTAQQMAAYLRPYQSDLATRGIDPAGGSGQAALADALVRNYLQLYQTGQANYGQKAQMLGLYGDQQPTGDVGAFGKSLAYAMLARAARERQQNPTGQPPGIADTRAFGTGGGDAGRDASINPVGGMDLNVPNWNFGTTNVIGGDTGGGRMYSLTGGEMF